MREGGSSDTHSLGRLGGEWDFYRVPLIFNEITHFLMICFTAVWPFKIQNHALKLWLEIWPTFILATEDLRSSNAKSKMADQCEATEGELIISKKKALKWEKSKFERWISDAYKLKDSKFGSLCERPKYSNGELYPMLQRSVIRTKTAINYCLSSKMSKLHQWMVFFDLPMPQEVFLISCIRRFLVE